MIVPTKPSKGSLKYVDIAASGIVTKKLIIAETVVDILNRPCAQIRDHEIMPKFMNTLPIPTIAIVELRISCRYLLSVNIAANSSPIMKYKPVIKIDSIDDT